MITRNFDNLMKGLCLGSNVFSKISFTETDWQNGAPNIVKNLSGTLYRVTNQPNILGMGLFGGNGDKYVNVTNTCPIMVLGSNDAEETYDDYTMSTLTTLSVVGNRGNEVVYDAEKATLHTSKIFVNNTTEDITVNEVGMCYYGVGVKTSSSSDYAIYILLCREKLAEPVILTANGGQATFSLTIDIPTANKPNSN